MSKTFMPMMALIMAEIVFIVIVVWIKSRSGHRCNPIGNLFHVDSHRNQLDLDTLQLQV
jgi:hypothetical protein